MNTDAMNASSRATRNVTGWLLGFASSLLGDQVYFLALAWAAIHVAEPAMAGVILAAAAIPRLLILLIGGAVADRFSPKRIIVITDTGRAVIMLGMALLLVLGGLGPWPLLAIALVFGAFDGFFLPAVGALPVRIVPIDLMGRIAAMRTITQRMVMFLGAPLAGVLLAYGGPQLAFAAAGVLFVFSVLSLALVTIIRRPEAAPGAEEAPEGRRSILADTIDGLRAVKRHPTNPWLLILMAVANLGFSGPVSVGLPMLASQNGWGSGGAGWLLGGFGAGAAITGILLFVLKRVPRAGMLSYIGVTVMGVALGTLAWSPTFWLAMASVTVLGLGSGIAGTLIFALLLTVTPEGEVGRVMGLASLSLEGVVPISYALTGVIAGGAGVRMPFLLGGVLIVLATVYPFTRHRMRVLELPTAGEPAEPVIDRYPH